MRRLRSGNMWYFLCKNYDEICWAYKASKEVGVIQYTLEAPPQKSSSEARQRQGKGQGNSRACLHKISWGQAGEQSTTNNTTRSCRWSGTFLVCMEWATFIMMIS